MDGDERTNRPDTVTYGRPQHAIESTAVLAFGVCSVVLAVQLASAFPTQPRVVALAVVVGYLAADLLAGIVHWLADSYGSPHTPIVGPTIIYGFREHHDAPEKMLEHDFVETNGASAAAALPLALLAVALPGGLAAGLFAKVMLATLTAAVVATNQVHKWAHMPRVPPAVRLLQRLHLILRPEEHARHHTAPFRTHYCITTGWMNAPLTRLIEVLTGRT